MKKIISVFICVCVLLATMITPVYATDDNSAKFSIDDVRARVGSEFSVVINVFNNPGIVSAKLRIGYDANVLELIKIEAGDFANKTSGASNYTFSQNLTKNPYTINWMDALSYENIATDGIFATLTFRVNDTAATGTTEIVITFDPNDVFDINLNNVAFEVANSTVTITDSLPGDTNDDGKINGRDYVLLLQSINGWDTEINNYSADVNGDGRINGRDYTLILQSINGWDVELQ